MCQPQSSQLDAISGHGRRRSATVRTHLTSEGFVGSSPTAPTFFEYLSVCLGNERRWNFEPALAGQARRHHLKSLTVLWDRLDEAVITMECQAEDSSAAAETIKSIIRQTAEFTGQITIRDIRIVGISRTTGGPSIVRRDHPPR